MMFGGVPPATSAMPFPVGATAAAEDAETADVALAEAVVDAAERTIDN